MRDTVSPPQSAPAMPGTAGIRAGSWRVAALVIGDLVSFVVFAAVGRRSHSEAAGLDAVGQIARTALPFALGWLLVSPFAGAFRRDKTSTPARMLARTELAWLAAWPATLLLRWALADDHQVQPSFAVVILIANAVFLGLWRTAFSLLTRRRA